MIYIFIIIFLVFIDLFSKKYVKNKYKLDEKVSLYKDKVYICYVKNEGLAYGILKKAKKSIYIIISICLIALFILSYFIFKDKSKLKKIAFSFALGGALGNFIDRAKNKSVTDFIYLKHKNTPIFNFADVFLFIAPMLLIFEEIFNGDK